MVSLHQLEFARRYGEHIIGLAHGSVVFEGPVAKLGPAEISSIYGPVAPANVDERNVELEPESELRTGTYA